MAPDQFEGLLVVCRSRVLEPEETIGLQITCEPSGLDRRQAVMNVMQQLDVGAMIVPQLFE